jgi:hypothetical protein
MCSLHFTRTWRQKNVPPGVDVNDYRKKPSGDLRGIKVEKERHLTRDELRDDMSGERCPRCTLRLFTAEELKNKRCNDCLPNTAAEFAAQRMQVQSNNPTYPDQGE